MRSAQLRAPGALGARRTLLRRALPRKRVLVLRAAAEVAVALADAPSTTTSTADADLEQLARAIGAQKLVRVGEGPLGRGLMAKMSLERPQVLLSVPLHNTLLICDDPLGSISVFSEKWQETWQEQHGRMPSALLDFLQGAARWDVRMTAWLLYIASELVDSPVWGPYISSLPPADEVTCLINYDADAAKELQVKELIAEAKTQHAWAVGVHNKYFGPRGELASLRLARQTQDTLWAMAAVRTRTFSEDVNGEALTLMVPYADLANHSFRHNSTFTMARDQRNFELKVLGTVAPGEEATISYGETKPNAEVVRDYGFTVPGNPNDRVKLEDHDSLPALNGASLFESLSFKGDWREGPVAPSRPELERTNGNPAARLVLARRRCVLLSLKLSDGFDAPSGGGLFGAWPPKPFTNHGRAPPRPMTPQAVPAERANVATVRKAFQAALDELPTTLEQDQELLEGYERGEVVLTALTAAALRYRLEHKALLREGVRLLDVYDAWLVAGR